MGGGGTGGGGDGTGGIGGGGDGGGSTGGGGDGSGGDGGGGNGGGGVGGGGDGGGQLGAMFEMPAKKKLRPLAGSPPSIAKVTRNSVVRSKRNDTAYLLCSSVMVIGSLGLLVIEPN